MNGIRNSSLSRIDCDLVVRVEDLALVQAQRLDDVLVGVGVDRFFEGLAQQELAALGRRDVAVGAQHDVVGGQRVGGDEEAEVALDDAALVFGQAVRVLPQSRCRAIMFTSCGIQWLAQVARYFSQAHLYLNGTSWLTSVWPLMMRLSAALTRRALRRSARRQRGARRRGWHAATRRRRRAVLQLRRSEGRCAQRLRCEVNGSPRGSDEPLLRGLAMWA